MSKKSSHITVTDQFCGAGGSSQGVRRVSNKMGGGLDVRLALNHWKLAIETHQANFPEAKHDCTDVSASDPRRYFPTTILITSPECTNHTLAKGQKQVKKQMDLFTSGKIDAAAERSRATMWDVPRFAEYHNYDIVITENVVDAYSWIMFDAWLIAMHKLGYKHKCVFLNSMFCWPTPQSRDRMYVVFWKKGNKAPSLDFSPIAHCPKCECNVNAVQTWKNKNKQFGKYGARGQYVYSCPKHGTVLQPYYYAAFNCIDWSNPGKRIGDRKKPLAPNTVTRIKYGIEKYGDRVINPYIINSQQSTGIGCRVKSVEDILPTIPTMPHLNVVMPFVMKAEHTQQFNTQSSIEALQTQTTRQTMSVCVPPVVPYIIEMNSTGKVKPANAPISTLTAGGINQGLVNMPLIVENKGQSNSRPVTDASWHSFISYYHSSNGYSKVTDPIGTFPTKETHAIINYQKPNIEDCYYRMLMPTEVKKGMDFEDDYIILGSGKDQVKQCGNAVNPAAMEWLIGQCVESLS